MLLQVHGIQKTYPALSLLQNVSFELKEKEKCALIGRNGCGKSTLLKIIMGVETADSGDVLLQKNASIAYLPQTIELEAEEDAYHFLFRVRQDLIDMEGDIAALEKEMASATEPQLTQMMARYAALQEAFERADGYAYRSKVRGILQGLGFTNAEETQAVSTFSGGQKTRLALGALLLQEADLLLLDEPTNHLDLAAMEWLENYLATLPCALLIVSHDRYFLNHLADKVVEIEDGTSKSYIGNYDAFSKRKEEERMTAYRAYLKNEAARRHEEAVIEKLRSFNREKSIKRAESRQKKLDKMEILEKPSEKEEVLRLRFAPATESGKDVLAVTELAKGFDGHPLFSNLSFDLRKGEKLALLGPNGIGKSTLLKIINGKETADAGSFKLGANVVIAYYDQEVQLLSDEKTVKAEIHDNYPDLSETKCRQHLAAFLFYEDALEKKVASLSGGERARLALCKLVLSGANFLILDEPTNHLDIESREVLETALQAYEGTLLYVSHDRYFIRRTANRIVVLEKNKLTNYPGDYDYYLEKSRAMSVINAATDNENTKTALQTAAAASAAPTAAKADWTAQKEEAARKRKVEHDLKKTEARIQALESKCQSLQEEMSRPENASDHLLLADLSAQCDEMQRELETLYENWESLASASSSD